MATKLVPLKQIMKDHKLNDGKACRRKLRAHFKGPHDKGERWEFTAKQVTQVLKILGVTKETPKTKTPRKKKAKTPAQPPAVVASTVSTPETA